MENPRMEYQKMIDQTTSIYATIFSGIVVFAIPQVFSVSSNSKYSLFFFVCLLLFVVSAVWWLKIQAWNKLLKAELKFKMEHDEEFRKYNEFIIAELRKKKQKDVKEVLFTNYADDLIPRILFFLTTSVLVISLLVLCLKG